VKNFVLFGDIHKSIYFLSWKEQGSQLSLLAKDFGSLDCFATEFLIDGSTLSLVVSDSDKNVQVICPIFCIINLKQNLAFCLHLLFTSLPISLSAMHWQLETSYLHLVHE
jgi:hypothetical protein